MCVYTFFFFSKLYVYGWLQIKLHTFKLNYTLRNISIQP